MSNRVAKAADRTPENQTAIARVVFAENDGAPTTLEVDGVLYQRQVDQNKARASLERSKRWHEVMAYGVPYELMNQVDMDIAGPIIDEWHASMRHIGHVLVYHGQPELWRLIYCEYNRENSYALGDETLFLEGEPTSGQADYTGPPTGRRYNTALEQAAQLARQQAG